MDMKYFRFLYAETGRCFMHFGEIKDTNTEEQFSFLYLRGSNERVSQAETEHPLFLCPESIDLAVLGRADENTEETLKGILQETRINTLVIPAKTEFAKHNFAKIEQLPGIGAIVRVLPSTDTADGPEPQVIETVAAEKEGNTDETASAVNEFYITAAGWNFVVKAYAEDSLVLAHSIAQSEKEDRFEDCVMSVKAVDQEKRCGKEREPDEYGCALGCTLRQDYDVCKYQRGGESPYFTGTILLPDAASGENAETLAKDLQGKVQGIRFFGLPDREQEADGGYLEQLRAAGSMLAGNAQPEAYGHKQYFIGTKSGLDDKTIADVARGGLRQIPAILAEKEGLCCSGLLKYAK